MTNTTITLGIAVVFLLLVLFASVKIVPEYERGVVFRLGRVIDAKGPGLFFIIPIVDRMRRVSLRTITMDIPPQDVITRDNVTVRVNAVAYFNVVDPVRSVVCIENHHGGTTQIAQTTQRRRPTVRPRGRSSPSSPQRRLARSAPHENHLAPGRTRRQTCSHRRPGQGSP